MEYESSKATKLVQMLDNSESQYREFWQRRTRRNIMIWGIVFLLLCITAVFIVFGVGEKSKYVNFELHFLKHLTDENDRPTGDTATDSEDRKASIYDKVGELRPPVEVEGYNFEGEYFNSSNYDVKVEPESNIANSLTYENTIYMQYELAYFHLTIKSDPAINHKENQFQTKGNGIGYDKALGIVPSSPYLAEDFETKVKEGITGNYINSYLYSMYTSVNYQVDNIAIDENTTKRVVTDFDGYSGWHISGFEYTYKGQTIKYLFKPVNMEYAGSRVDRQYLNPNFNQSYIDNSTLNLRSTYLVTKEILVGGAIVATYKNFSNGYQLATNTDGSDIVGPIDLNGVETYYTTGWSINEYNQLHTGEENFKKLINANEFRMPGSDITLYVSWERDERYAIIVDAIDNYSWNKVFVNQYEEDEKEYKEWLASIPYDSTNGSVWNENIDAINTYYNEINQEYDFKYNQVPNLLTKAANDGEDNDWDSLIEDFSAYEFDWAKAIAVKDGVSNVSEIYSWLKGYMGVPVEESNDRYSVLYESDKELNYHPLLKEGFSSSATNNNIGKWQVCKKDELGNITWVNIKTDDLFDNTHSDSCIIIRPVWNAVINNIKVDTVDGNTTSTITQPKFSIDGSGGKVEGQYLLKLIPSVENEGNRVFKRGYSLVGWQISESLLFNTSVGRDYAGKGYTDIFTHVEYEERDVILVESARFKYKKDNDAKSLEIENELYDEYEGKGWRPLDEECEDWSSCELWEYVNKYDTDINQLNCKFVFVGSKTDLLQDNLSSYVMPKGYFTKEELLNLTAVWSVDEYNLTINFGVEDSEILITDKLAYEIKYGLTDEYAPYGTNIWKDEVGKNVVEDQGNSSQAATIELKFNINTKLYLPMSKDIFRFGYDLVGYKIVNVEAHERCEKCNNPFAIDAICDCTKEVKINNYSQIYLASGTDTIGYLHLQSEFYYADLILTPIWEGKQITITHDGGNNRNGSVSTIIDYDIYESDKTTPTNDIKRDTHYLVMSNLNGGATTNIGFVDSFTKDQMMFPADFTATNISKYSSNHEGQSKVYVKLYDYVYSSTFSLKLNLSMGEDVKEVSLSAGTRTKSLSDGYIPGIFDVLDKNSTWYSSWLIPQGKMSKEDWEESFEYRDGYNSVVYRYQVKAQADDPNTDINEDIGGYYVEGVADVDQLTLVTIEIRKVYIGEEDYYEIKFIDAVCKVDFSVIEINWVLTENIYMTNNHQYVVEGENYDPEDYSLESLSKYMAYLRGESTTPATFIPDPWYIIKDYYQLRDILRYNMLHAKKIEYVLVAVSQEKYWVYSVINNKLNIEEFEEYRLRLERNDKLDDLYLCEDVLSDGVPVWQAALQLIGGRVPEDKEVTIKFSLENANIVDLTVGAGDVVKPLSYLDNWLKREFEIFIATGAPLPYKGSNNENEYRYTELGTDKIEEKLFYKNVKNIEDWTLSYQSFLARTCLPGGWLHKDQFRHSDNYKYTTMTFPTIFGSSETYAYNEDDENVVKTYNKDGAIVTYLSVNDNNKPYMTGAISGKNADVINNSIWLGRNELKDKNGGKVYNLVDQFAVKNDGQVTQVGTLSYKLAKGSNTVFNAEYSATFTNPDSLNRPYRTLVYSLANTMALLTDKDGNPVYDENTGERLPAEALMSTMNNITLGVKPQVGSADGISIEFADANSSIYKALYGENLNKYNIDSIYNKDTEDDDSYITGRGIVKEYKYTGFLNNNNLEEYNEWIKDGGIGYNDWISVKKAENSIVSNYYGKPNDISNNIKNYSVMFQEVTENKYQPDKSSRLTNYYSNPSIQQTYTIRLDKDGKVANFINVESETLGSTFTERWANAQTFRNYYVSRDLVQIFSQSGVMIFNYKFTGKYQGLQDYLDDQSIPIEARVNMYASIFTMRLTERYSYGLRILTVQTGVLEDGTPKYEMFLMVQSGDIPKAEKYSHLLGETYFSSGGDTLLRLNYKGSLYPYPARSDGMNYYANKYSVTFENANNVNKEDGQKDYYGQLSINNDVCYYNYNDLKSTFAYSLSGLKGVLNNNEQDIDKYNYSQEWKVSGFVEDDTSSNGKITLEIHKDYSNSVPKLYVYNDEVSGIYLDMPTTQSGGYKYYLLKVDGMLTNGGSEDNYDMILTITKKSALKYEIIFSGLKDNYKVSVHDIVLDSMPYEIISYLDDEAKDSQTDIINEILKNNIIDIYRDNVYLLSLYQFKFFYLEKVDNGYKVYLQKYSYDSSSFEPKVEDIDLNILLETLSTDYKDIISLLQRNKYFLTNEHVKDSLGFIVCIPNGDRYNTYSTSGWLEYGFRVNVDIIDPVENAFANLRTNEAVFHIKNIETPTKDYFTTEIRIRWIYGPSPIEERGFTIKPYSAPMHTIVDGEEKTGSEATYFNNVESAKIYVISSRELAEWDSTKVEIKNFGAEEVYNALNDGKVSADYTWTSDNKIDMYYAQNKAILIEIEKEDGCSQGTMYYGYSDNVSELRFDFDAKDVSVLSGHRWYFTDDNNKLIILLINSNRKAEPQKVKLSVNCEINKYSLKADDIIDGLTYSFEYAEDGNSFVTGKPSELVHGSALKVTYTISKEYCHSAFDFAISETVVGVQAYQIVREAKSDKIIIKATKDNNSLTVNGSLLGTTDQSIEIELAGYDDSKSAELSFIIVISTIKTDVGLTATATALEKNSYKVAVEDEANVDETTVPAEQITHGDKATIGITIPKSYEKSEIKVYLSNEPDVTDYTSLEYITISGYDFNEKKRTLTDNLANYEVGGLEIDGECKVSFDITITDNTYVYIKDLTKNTWSITPADSSVGVNSNYRLYGADYDTEWTTIDSHKVDEGQGFVYYIVLNEGCDFGPSGITFTQTASGRNNIQDGADDSTSTSRYTKAIDFTKTDYEDLVLSFNFYVDGNETGMSICKADGEAFANLVDGDTNRIVFKVSIDAVYTDFKLEISNIAALQYPVTFENWKEAGNQKLASVGRALATDLETLKIKSESLENVSLTEGTININVPYNYHAIITLKLQDGYMLDVQSFKSLFGDNVKKSTDIFSEDANWSNIFANQGVYLVVPDTGINWQTSEEFSIIISTANSGKQFDLEDVIKSINTAGLYRYSITNSWNSGFIAENDLNTKTINIPYDTKYQESEFTFTSTITDINKANETDLEVLYTTDSATSPDDANPVVVYNDKANNKLVVKIADTFFANLTMRIVVGEVKYYNLTFDHSSLVGGLSLGSSSNSYNWTQAFTLLQDGKTLDNIVSFYVTNGEVSTLYNAFVLKIQSDCEFIQVGDVYSLPCGSNINISINQEDVISGDVVFTINEDSFAGTSINVFTSTNTDHDIDLSSGVLALKTTAAIITNQLTIEGVTDDNDYKLLINGESFDRNKTYTYVYGEVIDVKYIIPEKGLYSNAKYEETSWKLLDNTILYNDYTSIADKFATSYNSDDKCLKCGYSFSATKAGKITFTEYGAVDQYTFNVTELYPNGTEVIFSDFSATGESQTNEELKGFTANLYIGGIQIGVLSVTGHENLCNINETNTTCDVPYGTELTIDISLNSAADQNVYNTEDPQTYIDAIGCTIKTLKNNEDGTADIVLTNVVDRSDLVNDGIRLPKLNLYLNRYMVDSNIFAINMEYCLQSESLDNFDPWDESSQYYYVQYGTYQVVLQESYYTPSNVDVSYMEEEFKYTLVNDVLKINGKSSGNKFSRWADELNFYAELDVNTNLTENSIKLSSKPNRYAIEFVLEPEMSDLPDDIDLKFYIRYLSVGALVYTDMEWATNGKSDEVSGGNLEIQYNNVLNKFIVYYSHDHVCDADCEEDCVNKKFSFDFIIEYNTQYYKLDIDFKDLEDRDISSPLDAEVNNNYLFKIVTNLVTYSINLAKDDRIDTLSDSIMISNGKTEQEITITPEDGYKLDGTTVSKYKDVKLLLSTNMDITDDGVDNAELINDYIIFRVYKDNKVEYSTDGSSFDDDLPQEGFGIVGLDNKRYYFDFDLAGKKVKFYFTNLPYLSADGEICFKMGAIYNFDAELLLTFCEINPNKYKFLMVEKSGCDIFEDSLPYMWCDYGDVWQQTYTIRDAYTELTNLIFTKGSETFAYSGVENDFFGSELLNYKIENNKLTIKLKILGDLSAITISADKNEYTTDLYYRDGEEVVAWDSNDHKDLLQPSVDVLNAKHGEDVTLVIDEVVGNVFTSFEVGTYDSENSAFTSSKSYTISELEFVDNVVTTDGFTITKALLRDIEGSECTNGKQLRYTITYTQTSNMDFVLNVEARKIKVTFNYISGYNPVSYTDENIAYNTSWSEYETYLLENYDIQFSGFAGLAFAGFIKLEASAIDGYTYQWTDSDDNTISIKEGIQTLDSTDKKSFFVKDEFETSKLVQNFTDIDGEYYAVYTREPVNTVVYFIGPEEPAIKVSWKVGMKFDDAKVTDVRQDGCWGTYNESFGSYMNQLKTRNNMHYLSNTTYSCLATEYEEIGFEVSTLDSDWEEVANKLEEIRYYFADKTLTIQLNSSHQIKTKVDIAGTTYDNIPDIRPFVKYTQELVVKDTEGNVVIIVNNDNRDYFYALQLSDEDANTYNIVRYKKSGDEGSYEYKLVSYTMTDINDELLFMVGKSANNNALKLDKISSGSLEYSTDNILGYNVFGDDYNILNKDINDTTATFKYEVDFKDNILVEYVIELDNGTDTATQYIARVYGSELASVEEIVGEFTTETSVNYNDAFSKDVLIATYLVDPSAESWYSAFTDKTGVDIKSGDFSKWGNAESYKSDNTTIGATISDNKLSDDLPEGFSHYRVSLTGKRGSSEYPLLVSNNTTWNNVVNVYSTSDKYLSNSSVLYNFLQVADLDLGTNPTGATMDAGEYNFYGNYNVRNGVVKITGDLLRPMFGNIANGTINGINIIGVAEAEYYVDDTNIPEEWNLDASTIHFGILALSAAKTEVVDGKTIGAIISNITVGSNTVRSTINGSGETVYLSISAVLGNAPGVTVSNITNYFNVIDNLSAQGVAYEVGEISDCKNLGNISVSATSTYLPSLVVGAGICNKADIVSNCINEGGVSVNENLKDETELEKVCGADAVGIVSVVGTKVTGCINKGDVKLYNAKFVSQSVSAIGICVRLELNGIIENCINHGSVTIDKYLAAKYVPGADTNRSYPTAAGIIRKASKVNSCTNTGDITNLFGTACGVVGATNIRDNIHIQGCNNVGTITGVYVSGIVFNDKELDFKTGEKKFSIKVDSSTNIGKLIGSISDDALHFLSGNILVAGVACGRYINVTNCANIGDITLDVNEVDYDNNLESWNMVIGGIAVNVGKVQGSYNIGNINGYVENVSLEAKVIAGGIWAGKYTYEVSVSDCVNGAVISYTVGEDGKITGINTLEDGSIVVYDAAYCSVKIGEDNQIDWIDDYYGENQPYDIATFGSKLTIKRSETDNKLKVYDDSGEYAYDFSPTTNIYGYSCAGIGICSGEEISTSNKISNCYNYGNVGSYSEESISARFASGIGQGFSVENSENYGNVTGYLASAGVSAMLMNNHSIQICKNYGEISLVTADDRVNDLTVDGGCVGGIVGNTVAMLQGCRNSGEIVVNKTKDTVDGGIHVGGIAGRVYLDDSQEILKNSYNTGKITVKQAGCSVYAGGVLGWIQKGMVVNCYSGSTSSENDILVESANADLYIGGVAGYIIQSEIKECYATSNVKTTYGLNVFIGGFAGLIDGNCDLTKCYAVGDIDVTNCDNSCYIGKFLGKKGTISGSLNLDNCYVNSNSSVVYEGCENISTNTDGEEKTLDNIWNYVMLNWDASIWVFPTDMHPVFHDDPNAYVGYTQITNINDLKNIASGDINNIKKYVLVDDIDMSGVEWDPIDASYILINGNGCMLKNLTVTSYSKSSVFGKLENCNIVGVGIKQFSYTFKSTSLYTYVGGLANQLVNCKMVNCFAEGNIKIESSKSYITLGGLVGSIDTSIIEKCYANCELSAISSEYQVYIGGLIGEVSKECVIKNSYSNGNISANAVNPSYCGGLVACMEPYAASYKLIISNCYSRADILKNYSHTSYSGGILGGNYETTDIYNCFTTGSVICAARVNSYYGFFIARLADDDASGIYNCYHPQSQIYTTDGIANEDKNYNTTDTMEEIYKALKDSSRLNWDPDIWNLYDDSYPTLKWQND
ncbi:MAG: hypothetical protein IJA61_00005 [Clostridia bacterium]|nr:hypothetical protein [Clostridia bacterium]